MPARVDLTDEETTDYIENGLVPTYAATDNIPAEQFKAAWFDPTRKVLSEKIVGTADTTDTTVIQSLTDGGPGQATTVMSLNIVNTAFVKYETSYAAAQALVMFAIVMVITLIQWRGQKKWADQ